MDFTEADFAAFYDAVHGYNPFPWQRRLAAQAVAGKMNKRLALPTSCGKTSILDVAIFALASQANRSLSAERTAALRTFFIIDRRVVVDEVTRHALKLQRRLRESLTSDSPRDISLREVAKCLLKFRCELGDKSKEPVEVAVLRGGMYRDETWTETPNAPLICVSTVDQIGSRLLFRGYGVSEYMRTIHAGLTGNDALFIVDEAHLSNPFVETLDAVARFRTRAEIQIKTPFNTIHMSATLAPASSEETTETEIDEQPFGLEDDDRENDKLKWRLSAHKIAELVDAAKKGHSFEEVAAREAQEIAKREEIEVIGIVVNRVASAREIFDYLRKAETDAQAVLLTGRIRPFDRDCLLSENLLQRISVGRKRGQNEGKTFVVATQTVEVGANLDFDALVTEAAALDALKQRFGRLDRLGEFSKEHGRAPAVIIKRAPPPKKDEGGEEKIDPVYGEALDATWKWLNEQAKAAKTKSVDFGIDALNHLLKQAEKKEAGKILTLICKPKEAPLMFPAHVDSWSQTSPAPHADPDVAPFLHGQDALEASDVQIVWRADLNRAPSEDDGWLKIIASAPPSVREALPVPLRAARAWLNKDGEVTVADVEGSVGIDRRRQSGKWRECLCWRGTERSHVAKKSSEIAPGDTLVVPADYGGADIFGWNPGLETEVSDIADQCHNETVLNTPTNKRGRRLLRLRLHRDVLRNVFQHSLNCGEEARERLISVFDAAFPSRESQEADDDFNLASAIKSFLPNLLEVLDTEASLNTVEPSSSDFTPRVETRSLTITTLHEAAKAALRGTKRRTSLHPAGRGAIVSAAAPNERTAHDTTPSMATLEETASDFIGSDDRASFTGKKVTLREHCAGVAAQARAFAKHCGLEAFVHDVEFAGLFHDPGKADERFQVLLHEGDLEAAESAAEPLAKSGKMPPDRNAYLRLLKKSGYPKGARHEFVSWAMLKSIENFDALVKDPDLVRHLIGTHHGRARPFAPFVQDNANIAIGFELDGHLLKASSEHKLEHLSSGWVEQFWRVIRRYGHWGTAYLETMLRLADGTRSAQEQRTEVKTDD